MTEVLRATIETSGIPYLELERRTGVRRASIARFVRGETSLRLDIADRLAAYFGIEIRPARK